MVDVPKMLWGPMTGFGGAIGSTNLILDGNATPEAVATTFIAPKSGTINSIGIRVTAITGDPANYQVGLFTVDTSGNPTTTNYGGSATQSYDYGTATGYHWVTLSTPATATRGDLMAAVIRCDGTTNYAGNAATFAHRGGSNYLENFPASKEHNGTSWFANGSMPLVTARYNDGDIAGGFPFNATAAGVNYHLNTTPDEVGNLLQTEFDCTIDGFYVWTFRVAATTTIATCYDSGGVLATKTFDQDAFGGSGALNLLFLPFDADVSLTANTDYRFAVSAGEATNRQYAEWTFPESASRLALPDGMNWQKTSRTDGGSWTDDPTKIVYMALRLKTIAVSGGGGTTINGPGPRIARPLVSPAGRRW